MPWKLSKSQQALFWRLWQAACEANGIPQCDREDRRRELLAECGFSSAKDIDKTKGFDRVKQKLELLAGIVPSPTSDGDQRRLLHDAGECLAELSSIVAAGYIEKLLRDRFKIIPGVRDITDLSNEQLSQLIITVKNRLAVLSKTQPQPV